MRVGIKVTLNTESYCTITRWPTKLGSLVQPLKVPIYIGFYDVSILPSNRLASLYQQAKSRHLQHCCICNTFTKTPFIIHDMLWWTPSGASQSPRKGLKSQTKQCWTTDGKSGCAFDIRLHSASFLLTANGSQTQRGDVKNNVSQCNLVMWNLSITCTTYVSKYR